MVVLLFFLRGQDKLSQVFRTFAFSLVYGLPCSGKQGLSLTGKRATVEGFRRTPTDLNGLQIKSGLVTNVHRSLIFVNNEQK